MAVNLSPVGGVAGQFFDNNGNPLAGGKLYTYSAGATTPQVTYTSAAGVTANSNPIILNSGGRVPAEIWLTDGLQYKFVLYTATDALIGSWDNVIGINSNFVNFVTSEEVQTATAGQTVFTLTTMQYQPGTNNLVVYVDGVNQVEGGTYSFVETSSTVVTFTSGLHVGAIVKFVSAETLSTGVTDASLVAFTGFKGQVGNVQDLADDDGSDWVGFLPDGTGAVAQSVQDKLRETVSVKDFGAVGDGVTDDTAAIQAALDSLPTNGGEVFVPNGQYLVSAELLVTKRVRLAGTGHSFVFNSPSPCQIIKSSSMSGPVITLAAGGSVIESLSFFGQIGNTGDGILIRSGRCTLRDVSVFQMGNDGIRIGTDTGNENNNLFYLENVKTKSNGQHGLHISEGAGPGADANAGTVVNIDAQSNAAAGVYLNGAQLNTFVGGAFQSNGTYGVHLSPNAKYNAFFGGDPEANVLSQVRLDNGSEGNAIFMYTVLLSGFSISNTSSNNRIETIDSNRLMSGLLFPPVPIPSNDPNTLDDYDEVSFTPVISGSVSAGVGTYTEQSGVATKIGRVVNFTINVSYSSHTGTGAMIFTGIPFLAAATGPRFIPAGLLQFEGPAPGAGLSEVAVFDKQLLSVFLRSFDPATGIIGPFLNISATGDFKISGSYTTN